MDIHPGVARLATAECRSCCWAAAGQAAAAAGLLCCHQKAPGRGQGLGVPMVQGQRTLGRASGHQPSTFTLTLLTLLALGAVTVSRPSR